MCLICAVLVCGVSVFFPFMGQETRATVALGNPDLMAFPCDTNYERQAPHFCVTTNALAFTGLTKDNTCRSFSALSTPTPAIDFMLVDVLMTAPSQNAVGTSNSLITLYTDDTCATTWDQVELNIYEQVAVGPPGTELARIRRQVWVPIVIVGNTSVIKYKFNGTSLGAGIGQFAKLAYYDH